MMRSPVGKKGSEGVQEMFRELREELREGLKGVRKELREKDKKRR